MVHSYMLIRFNELFTAVSVVEPEADHDEKEQQQQQQRSRVGSKVLSTLLVNRGRSNVNLLDGDHLDIVVKD